MAEHLHPSGRRPTRRTTLCLAAGAILAPVAARAQEAGRSYRIGVLSFTPRSSATFAAWAAQLGRAGFVEGGNLTIDPQGFDIKPERLEEITASVVASKPDVIMCGGDPIARAAKRATTTIPIVANCDDLVRNGLVASLAHPGGNVTGVSILATELDGKRQQILIDMIPGLTRLAALADLTTTTRERLQLLKKAAAARKIDLAVFEITRASEIAPAVEKAQASGAQAINVLASALFHVNHRDIIARIAAARLPAMYQWPEYVEEGALAGYGPRLVAIYEHQIARQIIKVLRGAKPADIPAEQPTDFELGINLKTAQKLGVTISDDFLARADEVIR